MTAADPITVALAALADATKPGVVRLYNAAEDVRIVKAAVEALRERVGELRQNSDHWHRAYQGYRRDFEAIYRELGVIDTDDTESAKRLATRLAGLVTVEARVTELEAKKWEVQHTDTMNEIVQLGMARDAAEAINKDMRDVLEFYADVKSWWGTRGKKSFASKDRGEKARAALKASP